MAEKKTKGSKKKDVSPKKKGRKIHETFEIIKKGKKKTDRKSVVQGKSVDLGGRRIIKKKKKIKKQKEKKNKKKITKNKLL